MLKRKIDSYIRNFYETSRNALLIRCAIMITENGIPLYGGVAQLVRAHGSHP